MDFLQERIWSKVADSLLPPTRVAVAAARLRRSEKASLSVPQHLFYSWENERLCCWDCDFPSGFDVGLLTSFDSTLDWKDCLMGRAYQSYASKAASASLPAQDTALRKSCWAYRQNPVPIQSLENVKKKTPPPWSMKHIFTWFRKMVWPNKSFGLFKNSIVLSLCEGLRLVATWVP